MVGTRDGGGEARKRLGQRREEKSERMEERREERIEKREERSERGEKEGGVEEGRKRRQGEEEDSVVKRSKRRLQELEQVNIAVMRNLVSRFVLDNLKIGKLWRSEISRLPIYSSRRVEETVVGPRWST